VTSRHLSEEERENVRQRANHLCEYCHTFELWQSVPFTIDHVIPLSLGGSNNIENLALACFTCNRKKSNQTEITNPETGEVIPLFNPRLDKWSDHFVWAENRLMMLGISKVGQATIETLELNRERIIRIRSADLTIDRHPPKDDPVQSTS
jgi:hypothetical protein